MPQELDAARVRRGEDKSNNTLERNERFARPVFTHAGILISCPSPPFASSHMSQGFSSLPHVGRRFIGTDCGTLIVPDERRMVASVRNVDAYETDVASHVTDNTDTSLIFFYHQCSRTFQHFEEG